MDDFRLIELFDERLNKINDEELVSAIKQLIYDNTDEEYIADVLRNYIPSLTE